MTATLAAAPLDIRLMNATASALFMGLGVLALGALLWWLVHLPAFAIRRIVVLGDLHHNNAVTLRANVAPMLSGNFFTMDLQAAQAAFEKAPWVRSAQVHREYPAGLRVNLQEHQAVAAWGESDAATLLNNHGEVFEASMGDSDDDLPRLIGPRAQSAQVLEMYQRLEPMFEALGLEIEQLTLTDRGAWRAVTDGGATLELGMGSPVVVEQRVQRFVRTLASVAGSYQRSVSALESADLRHPEGYAVRLRGVSTISAEAAKAQRPAPRPAPRPAARR